jgi:DNA-binding ferritin-like protein
MGTWDKERRQHELQLTEKMALQEAEMNALRKLLEQRNAALGATERAMKSLGDLLAVARDETTQLRAFAMERIDSHRDKLAKLRDEMEQRTHNIENQVHVLQDQHTGVSKLVNNMKETVDVMNQHVRQASEDIADIWRSKADVSCLEEQQQDLTEFMRHVNATVSSLRQQFGSLIDDVKSHFEVSANVVGTTTAKQIEDMRTECKKELKRVDEAVVKIDEFMRSTQDYQETLQSQVEEDQEKSKTELQGLKQSVEEQQKTRLLSESNVAIDLAQLHKGIHDLKAQRESDDSRSSMRHDIVEMLVECQLLSALLEQQDDHDRKNIALYGYTSGESKENKAKDNKAAMSCTLPDLGSARGASKTPRKNNNSLGGAHSEVPVLSLDKRCLSCSGSSTTVMAGFKLACLTYAPTEIEIEKTHYRRSELISKQLDMLRHARDSMKWRAH